MDRRLSVCLSVCLVRDLTFESLNLETSFSVCRYVFRISRLSSYIKENWVKVKVTTTNSMIVCSFRALDSECLRTFGTQVHPQNV